MHITFFYCIEHSGNPSSMHSDEACDCCMRHDISTSPSARAATQAPCHSAGVSQLNANGDVLAVRQFHVLFQHIGMRIQPDAGVFGRDAAVRLDGGGFYHDEPGLC